MIKHKKIIISLLLAYALFILGIFNVKAEEIHTFTMSATNYNSTNTATNFYLFSGTTSTINKGIGYIYGSYRTYMVTANTYDFVYGVFIGNGGDINSCNISTATIDNQSTDVVIGSFICPYDSNKSFDYIRFIKGDNFTNINIHIPYGSVTFIPQSGNSASDVSSIINTLQDGNITYLINQFRTRTNEQLVDQYNLINSIKSQLATNSTTITNIENNTKNINDSINDSSIDTDNSSSSYSSFGNTANSGMNNTPVSSLITLPITFLQGVNTAISGSCTNVNYIELYNYQLVLPCLNLSQRLGEVWTIIDTIFSCMLIFSIGKSLVKTFARLSDMDTNIMYECYANGRSHEGE